MPLTYRGTTYEATTISTGLDWVEVQGATHRGIPYTSYQLPASSVPHPPTRRVYRGIAY